MKNRGAHIDFNVMAKGFSPFQTVRRQRWHPGLCGECFRPKELCWNTGEDIDPKHGKKPTQGAKRP